MEEYLSGDGVNDSDTANYLFKWLKGLFIHMPVHRDIHACTVGVLQPELTKKLYRIVIPCSLSASSVIIFIYSSLMPVLYLPRYP